MKKINLPFFIAQRISTDRGGRANRAMIRVATLSVVIGTAVMVITLCVIMGFKREISSKVVGFGADIQLVNLDGNVSMETSQIAVNQPFEESVKALPFVTGFHAFAVKAGLIKTDEATQGVALKGVDKQFDWGFFRKSLVEGDTLAFSDSVRHKDVLISKTLSKLMKLGVGDKFEMLFIQEPPRRDRFRVRGIYDTQLPEFDKIMVLTDLRNVQRLNDWDSTQVSGFEVTTGDLENMEANTNRIDQIVTANSNPLSGRVVALSIKERYPNIFEWIEVQDINVVIIVTIMLLVSGFNMISMVLIILFERTAMIGILKAMGMQNSTLQKIFLIRSSKVIFKGLIWGNAVGLSLCLLQRHFGILKLNEVGYFLTVVPIYIDGLQIVLLNICSFVVILLLQILPTFVIARISPQKTIKYE